MKYSCDICQRPFVDDEPGWTIIVLRGMPDAHDGAGNVVRPERLFPSPLVHCFCPDHPLTARDAHGARESMVERWHAFVAEHFPAEHSPKA